MNRAAPISVVQLGVGGLGLVCLPLAAVTDAMKGAKLNLLHENKRVTDKLINHGNWLTDRAGDKSAHDRKQSWAMPESETHPLVY